MTINLNKIIPAPWNPRKDITEESVASLKSSMNEIGQTTAISIGIIKPTGEEYLIAGHRRVKAAELLGWKEIKCIKIEYDSIEDAKIATFTDNLQREDIGAIELAEKINAMLDSGFSAKKIARKMDRTVNWVYSRRSIMNLCYAFKAVADKFTTDQLEKIASFEPSVQERVAEYYDADADDWDRVKHLLQNESKDLANAKFDTAACHECLKRTGAQADLWGVCDGCLGQCQDKACYEQKVKDEQEAKIAELTKGANEVVRVRLSWQMPSDDESSPKKCKQYPCAYVNVDYRGEVEVKWGESKKAKDERKKKEAERREAERAEERAASAREDGIVDALDAWKDGTGGGDNCCVGLDDIIEKEVGSKLKGEVKAFVTDAVRESIDSWQDAEKWARILRAFPSVAKLAGVGEDDAKYLIDNNSKEDDDE